METKPAIPEPDVLIGDSQSGTFKQEKRENIDPRGKDVFPIYSEQDRGHVDLTDQVGERPFEQL